MKKKIVVIGSGIGGLAAACRLAARGNDLEVFEKCGQPGGTASAFKVNEFQFDSGPTIITAPFMFDNLFSSAGRHREDYFEWLPVNPFYRFEDVHGRRFEFSSNLENMERQVERIHPADVDGVQKMIDAAAPILERSYYNLQGKPVLRLADMLQIFPDLIRLSAFKSVHSYVSSFLSDPFLEKAFSFNPLIAGGDPSCPAVDLIIYHFLKNRWGMWVARGGMRSILDGMVRLLEELGGRIYLNTEVTEILVDRGKASGVRLSDGSIHRAEAVISDADVEETYLSLIPPSKRGLRAHTRFRKVKFSSSMFVLNFGTRRRYLESGLAYYNVFLPGSLSRHPWPFGLGIPYWNPPLIVSAPSLIDPSIAPPGCDAFIAAVPVPNLETELSWSGLSRQLRDQILTFLEEKFLPGLRENIIAEHFIDPFFYRDALGCSKGSVFSIAPSASQSFWFRPHNRSGEIRSLFLVGAGTHPGAGFPTVLNSALIVEKIIEQGG